jgi:hypothetical protein
MHTIDPAQVGVDQTPPQLGLAMVAELQNNDTSAGCMGTAKCGWEHSARITNLATDDMTAADKIGYRVTQAPGAEPHVTTGLTIPALASTDGTLTVFWDGDDEFDFSFQLIAVDAAGNESAPATVRVRNGSGCSVGRRPARAGLELAVLALALASAAARQRRRRASAKPAATDAPLAASATSAARRTPSDGHTSR